jgi:excinuclease ABC subunit A
MKVAELKEKQRAHLNGSRDTIEVIGAREHNLKDIDVSIPKNKLTVVTGLSGSGKSSLAFDTIYAEGQRRYLETLSSYARQFIGNMERPDVESITGLSPVISIEQKSTGWNPRSTVGTVTELYDLLRLLYARIGEAYSYETGERMVKYTEDQIVEHLVKKFENKKVTILAPSVRGRKGHYRELLEHIRKMGYTKVRIDGDLTQLKPGLQLDRYKTHDIEVVIDRIKMNAEKIKRVSASVKAALKMGKDLMFVQVGEESQLRPFSKQLMDPSTGLSYEDPSPNTFSFNSPYGACPDCKGLGKVHTVDLEKVLPDENLTINEGGIAPLGEVRQNQTFKQLRKIANHFGFTFASPIKDIPKEAIDIILYGGDSSFESKKRYKMQDWTFSLSQDGLIKMLTEWYKSTSSERIRSWAERFMQIADCPTCDGTRLKKDALHFKLGDRNIAELAKLDFTELADWFQVLPDHLDKRQLRIGEEVIKEIRIRLKFLLHVGLDYLNMDRPARTLSGGEAQRTRLATQIGSALTGITYILDEPSIGLHSRDNHRLIQALQALTKSGNSVIVVEHDKDIMLASDYLIDLGPGAGALGGELVARGVPAQFVKGNSETAAYLRGDKKIEVPKNRRNGNGEKIALKGATGHNLQSVDLEIPLGRFICVTGVSGSGKSSLINETLYPILRNHFYNSAQNPLEYECITGLDHIDKVIEIDQSPIGRTPRSNPATYTGVFTDIRKLFTDVPEAKIRGYKPGRL